MKGAGARGKTSPSRATRRAMAARPTARRSAFPVAVPCDREPSGRTRSLGSGGMARGKSDYLKERIQHIDIKAFDARPVVQAMTAARCSSASVSY